MKLVQKYNMDSMSLDKFWKATYKRLVFKIFNGRLTILMSFIRKVVQGQTSFKVTIGPEEKVTQNSLTMNDLSNRSNEGGRNLLLNMLNAGLFY